MMGFALVAPRKSPRSRLNCAYAPAPSKAVRGPLGYDPNGFRPPLCQLAPAADKRLHGLTAAEMYQLRTKCIAANLRFGILPCIWKSDAAELARRLNYGLLDREAFC